MFLLRKSFREKSGVVAGNYIFILFIQLCFFACNQKVSPENQILNRTVEVKEQNGRYQLYRHGKPYFIKGAAGTEHLELIKAAGGNSIRVWDVENAQEILDNAHKNGLTVTLGLRVAYAGYMDYGNEKLVSTQLERLKKEVIRFKDHPALLMWGIGNELNARIGQGAVMEHVRLWQAVNDIAKMIHEVDPNHPTTTMLPDVRRVTTRFISTFCQDIDLLSFNVYKDLNTIPERVKAAGWDGPYLVSEYGGVAYWETPGTEWYAQVEPTSSEKAKIIQQQYHDLTAGNNGKFLGSYVFYWGFKREYTSTWFSFFTECDEVTEMVDALQYVWTGSWPVNRAPSLTNILVNGTSSKQNIYLEGNQKITATINVQYPKPEDLILSWEVQKDFVEVYFDATFGQDKAEIISSGTLPLNLCKNQAAPTAGQYQIELNAPAYEGPYRLMVSVVDKQNKVATGNAVFYVYN